MSRSRNIKPGTFRNELLAECEPLARILFIALWCEADRAGRLEDRPKRIKVDCLPYDDCDVDALLNQLAQRGFIVRYQVANVGYIAIPMFPKHQTPHIKEQASTIPAPDMPGAGTGQAETLPSVAPPDCSFLISDSLTQGVGASFEGHSPEQQAEAIAQVQANAANVKRLREAGRPDASLFHSGLAQALADGLNFEELIELVALHVGKPVAYLVKAAKGRRESAAAGGSTSSAVSPARPAPYSGGGSELITDPEVMKRRQAEADAAMRAQYPEMFQ